MNMNEDSRKIPTEKQGDARQLTDEQLNEVTGGAVLVRQLCAKGAYYRCTNCGEVESIITAPNSIPDTLGRCSSCKVGTLELC